MNESESAAPFRSSYVAFADEEISSVGDDKLSRAQFAGRVAELIESIPIGADSTVIGLIGPWGGGKTSLLNLIRADLAGRESMGVAQFTPWAVTDSPALMVEFFSTLLSAHESLKSVQQREKWKSLALKMGPIVGSLGSMGKITQSAVEAYLEAGNWQKQFRALDESISASGVRILITVDDVDRLHGDEILTLIKTIRMLGRFHNVHYLLAYDHGALVDALKPSVGGNARRAGEYLEKIVQYPLDIPPAQQVHLQAMLDEGLAHLFSDDPFAILSDAQGRFQVAFERELKWRLTTVRSVKRFVAQANHYYALISGHVDVCDFLVLTFLRLHFPAVYNALPQWRHELLSSYSGNQRDAAEHSRNLWKIRLEGLVAGPEDAEILLRILKRLFPAPFVNEGETLLRGRVSNRHYFDRHFAFGLPEGDVSDLQVRQELLGPVSQGVREVEAYVETFTSPSSSVRRLAVDKAAHVIHELDDREIPTLTKFVVWLMGRETEADPRYMFGDILGDLLLRHPSATSDEDSDRLLNDLPGVRSLRSALDRVDVLKVNETEQVPEVSPKLIQGKAFRRSLTRVGVRDLIGLANVGEAGWRDFIETHAVLEAHGDMHLVRGLISKALSANELDLGQVSAMFVYPEIMNTAGEQRLLDLDLDRLMTLLDDAAARTAPLPSSLVSDALGHTTDISWEQRVIRAAHKIQKWRRTAFEVGGD
ncbi:KAP family P-loop NTPase fold protein [Arthrobacter sp. HMWF013]|uniref:KAP family P-loop NTPase fold protein n=1 Tax=Arthrobacter sp. HMWF013 TaxID=2056849 RepID=UPI000D38505C|nr:P-loop NTPase fold protein [Arthrobacter sp. HMWF013]PTT69213.1 hypothetical protein DBR22_04385 [Arthrobacter sp. HMWF013]